MYPTIQLIQLTLRVEREAEAQRRAATTYRSASADEETVRAPHQEQHVKGDADLLRRRPQCECA